MIISVTTNGRQQRAALGKMAPCGRNGNSTPTSGAGTLGWKLQKGMGFGLRGKLSAELKKFENRRAGRRGSNNNAWIRPEGSFGLQACQVVDISRTGVRLRIANLQKVPEKFILLFSKFGAGHLARVKWRRGIQVGAELLTAGSPDTSADERAAEPSNAGGDQSNRNPR